MKRAHGAILVETLIALAIFVATAGIALRIANDALSRLETRARTQQALDFGMSKLAEIDAGLVAIGDLRGDEIDSIGSMSLASEPDAEPLPWTLDVQTKRSPYGSLSVVQLSVIERDPPVGPADDVAPIAVTVRELIELRGADADAYEVDELIEDLPELEPPVDDDDDRAADEDDPFSDFAEDESAGDEADDDASEGGAS